MKTRFSTIDIVAIVHELQKLVGMRVNQVYDIDSKTYLLKLNRYEEKVTLLIESGIRIHTTEFEWPKSPAPSGFAMKLRKHIRNKRLEKLSQVGIDRIIDLQFGVNEAEYHVILELYDRGNIILADYEYVILNILRPRTNESEDVKFIVREKYPVDKARQVQSVNYEELKTMLLNAKEGESLRKILNNFVKYGGAVLDHALFGSKFVKNYCVGKEFSMVADLPSLISCLEEAENVLKEVKVVSCKGYIIHNIQKVSSENSDEIVTNVEFHPFLFHQHKLSNFTEYASFDKAVDCFFSNLEGQKIDIKTLHREKEAVKKLHNVRKDHEQRLNKLKKNQTEDAKKAQLIEMNLDLVDKAILIIRSAIANQISWSDIQDLIREAQSQGDLVAKAIKKLKLDINHFTILLSDPFVINQTDDGEISNEMEAKPELVDIDLDLSAYANARKYYDLKRHHAKKEQKTIESSEKAYKSAEKKTKQTLKEVAMTSTITKARKTFWFEKFLWFISSENYLVIAGRDIQQNEVIVKRYMKQEDIYVHADIHGASSVVIKNCSVGTIPPKTLNEAGIMAVCYSAAWDSKVLTNAWWVYSHQVTKTAPSGEYLTAGSFMIRGKKNYLPPSQLTMGFGFLFKLDDDSIERHKEERQLKHDDVTSEISELSIDDNEDEVSLSASEDETVADSQNNTSEMYSENFSCSANIDNEPKAKIETLVEFPDTEVKFDVLTRGRTENDRCDKNNVTFNDTTVIIQCPQRKNKQSKLQRKTQAQTVNETEEIQVPEKHICSKRGQKGKLKKIKEKYKYQDDEERELRMKILASAGSGKEEKLKKQKKVKGFKVEEKHLHIKEQTVLPSIKPSALESNTNDIETEIEENQATENDKQNSFKKKTASFDEELEEETEEKTLFANESEMLNSLTGSPVLEDTLLFAIPVCAPYCVMQSYKFKVKVMPGTGRRGKASKTALHMFLNDKTATSREKDLLRSVKDQDISRNFPGKVKLASRKVKNKL